MKNDDVSNADDKKIFSIFRPVNRVKQKKAKEVPKTPPRPSKGDPSEDSLLSPASLAIMKKFSCPTGVKKIEKKAPVFKTPPRPSKDEPSEDTLFSPASLAIMKKFSSPTGVKKIKKEDTYELVDLTTPPRPSKEEPGEDTLFSPASLAIMKKFSSPTGVNKVEKKAAAIYKTKLPEERVVRKRADRALLHGFDCRCCAKYYDALNLSPESRKRRIDQVSRHRGVEELPPTPPRYWDLEMPSSEERRRLGWDVSTDSPLLKKPKGKSARKLFS